jgi:Mg2+/Co2+ transporter CorB
MLINILDLEHGRVDDVMVPRQAIVGLDLDADWDDIVQTLTQSLFTRLPVWRGDLDNMVGLLHIRTVVTQLARNELDREGLMRAIRKPYFVPEGTALTQQLLEFQSRERRMGLVVDEYGDIQGLVTLDDILEEIVGEYTSEGGSRQRRLRQQADGSWIIDGAATVRMLNRRLDWDLPTTGPNTINGLLLETLESIPDGQTSLRIGDHLFTIIDLADKRIRKVKVRSMSAGRID